MGRKRLRPRVEPIEEAIGRTGWRRGTPCEKRVIEIFQAAKLDALPRELLRDLLVAEGHKRTTVERTLTALVTKGNLRPARSLTKRKELSLVDPQLRWTRCVEDRRLRKLNRFGECETEANARYVRNFLSDRLDDLFENPNSYLARVLRAIELAGAIAEAAILHRPDALADAVETYRREWLTPEPNEHRRGLDSARLFEALSVGLFIEEFEGDEEVKERLKKHYDEMAKDRETIIKATNAENERRRANGEPLLELDTTRFDTPRDALRGLVPLGGGMRVGLVRLKAFLEVVGALPEAEKLADWHRLPRPAA